MRPRRPTLSPASFTDNTVTGVGGEYVEGGAIADAPYVPSFPGDSLTITGTTFSGNQAAGARMGGSFAVVLGGAIYSPGRPLSIVSSSFVDNQAIGTSPPVRDGVPGGAGIRRCNRCPGTVGAHRSFELPR